MMTRLTVVLLLVGLASRGRGQSEPTPMGRLTSFDPLAVQIERREQNWVLLAGDKVLRNCGRREQEAYQVWNLIRQLGLNQHGVIGEKEPIMEYWLISGQPPRTLPRGLRVLPINLEELRLEQSQRFWVLRETTRVLFNFGADEQGARQAMTVLKTHGFNRVGIVGQAVPAMLLFVTQAEGSGSQTLHSHHESLKPPEKAATPATPSIQTASFYPTPIVPPLRSGMESRPVASMDRGRAARDAAPLSVQGSPQVAALVATTRASFDYRQVQARRENNEWVLSAGGQVLAKFGFSERHAHLAYALMQHYRLTEMHQIGAPESGVRYFLSNGQVPRGLMIGVMGDNFQPDQLVVQPIHDRFFLVQRGQMILDGGPKEEDARELLQVIRRYGFDHVCRVGPSEKEGLTLLVKRY